MAEYNGRSKRIKNALKTVLNTITYDAGSGAEPAFTAVLDNTQGEFDGYPALRILPADYTTDKAAVSQNDRTASYVIIVHLPLESTPEAESATYDKMYDLTDLILDTLDVGDFTGALTDVDPTLGTWILNATRGDWAVNTSKGGAILMCDINCEVKYSKDLA